MMTGDHKPEQGKHEASSESDTEDLVTIQKLKTLRTKLKLKVTNTSRRLIQTIEANVACEDVLNELEACMCDFNDSHDEYCLLIECNDELHEFREVNGLDLMQYQDAVCQTYNEAKLRYLSFVKSKDTAKLSQEIEITSVRLKSVCESLNAMITKPDCNVASVKCYKDEMETMSESLLQMVSKLKLLNPSGSFSEGRVNQLILEVDEVRRQCSLKEKITDHAALMGDELGAAKSFVNVDPVLRTSGLKPGSGTFSKGKDGVLSSKMPHSLSFSSPGHCFSGQTPIVKNEIHLKKTALPEFSGHRKDWPEFKAVWRELAESHIQSPSVLAYELKRSLKGAAKEKVQNIYITKPEAYELIWERLCEYYDDVTASVHAALEGLAKLKSIRDDDYKGLVSFIDATESAFCQLEELGQVEVLTMRDIDRLTELLPNNLKMLWVRHYHQLDDHLKLRPFPTFMKFLCVERAAVARLAENSKKSAALTHFASQSRPDRPKPAAGRSGSCAVHTESNVKHNTADCREYLKLPLDERYQKLKNVRACFNCLGSHRRDRCSSKLACKVCDKLGHHFTLCRKSAPAPLEKEKEMSLAVDLPSKSFPSSSHLARDPNSMSLYAIFEVVVTSSQKTATVFCDNGSNTTYITHSAAERLRAKKKDRYTLAVTTMGNVDTEYDSRLYELSIRTTSGKIVQILAFGMEEITGPVSKLDGNCLSALLPQYDPSLLQRKSGRVDILLGCDYFGLHPKQELTRVGEHLSVMRGELGVCLQGCHPELKENTMYSSLMIKTLHEFKIRTDCNHVYSQSHPEFSSPCQTTTPPVNKTSTMFCKTDSLNFITGEDIATETYPRCGSCKCGKCPIVGHSYSFKEEQELLMIRNNLQYDAENSCWCASYPWIIDPSTLPDNYHVALATLKSTESTLKKDVEWADKYQAQMQDMLDRSVARKLTPEEIKEWKGPVFYISHLAVLNPNSNSTPVRIVFNSSQLCNGVSLNSALAKGPDNYINNLIGLLLRWREHKIAFVGDIRKMFNSVHINELEQHCHRFLWRNMDVMKEPDIYVITRVNMGDRPAPAISTEALYLTADRFKEDSPSAAYVLRHSSYVDDLVDSVQDAETASKVTREVEEMLAKGSFKIKCWQFSGETDARSSYFSEKLDGISLLKGSDENTRVLGVNWHPAEDQIRYKVTLNFSKKKKGVRTGPCLQASDLPHGIPVILTRRIVLEQVMAIFDPLGILCPFTLLAKVYLRETWSRKLDWDDALPDDLRVKWICFFSNLFQVEKSRYPRCLRPDNATGQPWLIIMSDGSDLAYGFAAYIRWQTADQQFWCRLIFAKCRIAPINKLTTPQMELNAAVLSKRARKVLETEMRFKFERVLHIVDSDTVLSMIKKTSTRFKVYEGVRIGEIQAATNGDMSEWAWISGKLNIADWLTRGRVPEEILENSEWWNGSDILYQPLEEWGLKFRGCEERSLPGEKKIASAADCHASTAQLSSVVDYDRFSSVKTLRWVIARIISCFRCKSFKGGCSLRVTPTLLQESEDFIVRDIQTSLQGIDSGRFAALKPFRNDTGIWCVGSRLSRFNPMTPDSLPQKLLAYNHPATRLMMRDAHQHSHGGRNATLAKFREKFWTPNGSKMAWQAKNNCQLCKLRACKLLEQNMGQLPESRLKPAPPFCNSMVDFFGPYFVRGEVQKRTSGKCYGLIFTDLVMRAVHIEPVFGYDTASFLMALIRFTSIRGWPSVLYSDPGSQFIGADNELKHMWNSIDQSAVSRRSSENGLQWIFGPADSPWQQGAVESLVKAAKRAITFSMGNQRLSASEFMTLCAEVTNLLNERPIGIIPCDDDDINALTPNSLLLGRASSKNPGGWQNLSSNLSERYHLVQHICNHFWARWTELCAPSLVVQRKWHKSSRNLRPGDVVLVFDKNTLRGHYRLGLIRDVFPGVDGKVRKVSLSYKNFKTGEKLSHYSGAKDTVVIRTVQKLALLVPVDIE